MEKQFITKLNDTANLDTVKDCVAEILAKCPWPNGHVINQIGLTHRANALDTWLDACGGTKDNQKGKLETDFTLWNEDLPYYLVDLITNLAKKHNFTPGRVRIMRLLPKSGLTMHQDPEERYHLAITTNKGCYVCTDSTLEPGDDFQLRGYHIPADGNFYKIDTRVYHFVYNSGDTERIHLVINALANN